MSSAICVQLAVLEPIFGKNVMNVLTFCIFGR